MKRKHHDLLAWQKSIQLVKAVYAMSSCFPSSEQYGLTAQIRRSAVSVPSNIAEGAARNTSKEFLHFLGVARGSLSELETQVIIARELGLATHTAEVEQAVHDIFGLLGGLIKSLRAEQP